MIQSSDNSRQLAAACAALILLLLALAGRPINCHSDDNEQFKRLGPMWLHPVAETKTLTPPMSSKLDELLTKRRGPAIRASSDYKDFTDIGLNESLEAWRLLHERAKMFAQDQAQLYEAKLAKLVQDSDVSLACSSSVAHFFESIKRLDSWAVQMWSASGNFPPTGLFDGHFTDLGSYRGCIDIERPLSNDRSIQQQNANDTKVATDFAASYCMLGFRPVVPSRPRFHQIYQEESTNLTGLFESADVFAKASHFAQYFHYLYMRVGICVPIECSSGDVQQISNFIAKQLAVMPAPVRCITRARFAWWPRKELPASREEEYETGPLMINLNWNLNAAQWISLLVIGSFFTIVFLVTLWHALEITRDILFSSKYTIAPTSDGCDEKEEQQQNNHLNQQNGTAAVGLLHERNFKDNCINYFSIIVNGREFLDTRMRPNEILCLHGFRVLTMFWIICVHTLQYNEWSGFSRAFENVNSLRNPAVQPLINANYVVDNFFLMSGMLAAYSIWNNSKGASINFSAFRCLLGRYLRLTPQVLLVSLAYILLPLLSNGPFWYDMTHMPAKYCERNWWVNLLHVQSFYREHEMCNLVGWWISVDMFYYVIGLGLLWLILNKHLKLALTSTGLLLTCCTIITAWRHYTGGFTPNNLGTVPQIGEVWSEFVVQFFWSPYPHAFVFFLGLWLGYAIANKLGYRFVRRNAKIGWFVSVLSLLAVNYSTRLWMTGTLDLREGSQFVSTGFNIICVIIWASAFGWMIVACHYGCAPLLNKLLSNEGSIMLSKASFIIYLSHMLILRAFFGSQYNLLEVSLATILTILVAMCFFSVLLGVFLCVAFEGPCLKFQRFVLKKVKQERRQLPIAGSAYLFEENQLKEANNNTINIESNKRALDFGGPASVTLLK